MFSSASGSDQFVLFAPAAVTVTDTGEPGVAIHRIRNAVVFTLDVTAAAAAVGDTLDVFVQTLTAAGIWVDVVHFTQVLGNGGAKRFVAKILAGASEAMFAPTTALNAGSVRNIIGDLFRMRCDVVSSSAPSFTFGLTAQAI